MAAQPNIRTQEFFSQVIESPTQPGFFDMPTTPYSNLLSSIMRHWSLLTRSSNWWMGSLSLAIVFYLVFLGLAVLDKSLFSLKTEAKWATLFWPSTLLYLTLATTRLVHLLHNTVRSLRNQTAADSCQPAIVRTYALSRPLEIAAMMLGAGLSIEPQLTQIGALSWSAMWQTLGGGALGGALFGWHLYCWSYRTWGIFQLYLETHHSHELNHWILFKTLSRWSMGITLFFSGALLLKIGLLNNLWSVPLITYGIAAVIILQILLIVKISLHIIIPPLNQFLNMPMPMMPSLLDDFMSGWMAICQTRSRPLATLFLGALIYLPGLVIAMWDNTLYNHESGASWWNRLLYPSMVFYHILAPLAIRHLFSESITEIQNSVSITPKRFKQLLIDTYRLNRGHEIRAALIGVTISFIFAFLFDYPSYLAMIYSTILSAVIFGLTGWQVYTGLTKTKRLSQLLNQLQGLNLARQEDYIGPIMRWDIAVALSFIGGMALSAIFLPNLRHIAPIITYTFLTFATILVFIFNKVPTTLLPWFRMARIIVIFMLVMAIGTIGFYYLENQTQTTLTPLDALYMTTITMTTIGYGDITPKTEGGKLFIIIISLFAVGISTYAISALASFIVEGDINELLVGRRMSKEIAKLNNHMIICGAGGVGLQIANEFYRTHTPFVIIDQQPDAFTDLLHKNEMFCIQGDATKDEVLLSAGIERARGLVAALSDDKENAFVILTARALNADQKLRIIARLTDEDNLEKLKRAGANEIVSPHSIGGLRMASVMLRPSVVSFLDSMLRAEELTGQTLRIEEITFDELNVPALIGQEQLSIMTVGRHTQLLVIAIKGANGDYEYKPRSDTMLQSGDVLIVLGTPEEMAYARGY